MQKIFHIIVFSVVFSTLFFNENLVATECGSRVQQSEQMAKGPFSATTWGRLTQDQQDMAKQCNLTGIQIAVVDENTAISLLPQDRQQEYQEMMTHPGKAFQAFFDFMNSCQFYDPGDNSITYHSTDYTMGSMDSLYKTQLLKVLNIKIQPFFENATFRGGLVGFLIALEKKKAQTQDYLVEFHKWKEFSVGCSFCDRLIFLFPPRINDSVAFYSPLTPTEDGVIPFVSHDIEFGWYHEFGHARDFFLYGSTIFTDAPFPQCSAWNSTETAFWYETAIKSVLCWNAPSILKQNLLLFDFSAGHAFVLLEKVTMLLEQDRLCITAVLRTVIEET